MWRCLEAVTHGGCIFGDWFMELESMDKKSLKTHFVLNVRKTVPWNSLTNGSELSQETDWMLLVIGNVTVTGFQS